MIGILLLGTEFFFSLFISNISAITSHISINFIFSFSEKITTPSVFLYFLYYTWEQNDIVEKYSEPVNRYGW